MTTLLVNDGWRINANTEDEEFFLWTNQADVVDEGDEIPVDVGVVANTLGGDDIITGTGDNNGIDNDGTITTGRGNDSITGTGNFNGIFNDGMITIGNGNDIIEGDGNNIGIINFGMIDTENGNDSIMGTGQFGIVNVSSSKINTGNGKDIVDALTGGFDGGGTVNLGRGKDLIRGFGEQIVDGGQGMDTAELGIDCDVDLLSLGSSFDIKIGEMEFTDVETFVFNDETFSLQDLQGEVV